MYPAPNFVEEIQTLNKRRLETRNALESRQAASKDKITKMKKRGSSKVQPETSKARNSETSSTDGDSAQLGHGMSRSGSRRASSGSAGDGAGRRISSGSVVWTEDNDAPPLPPEE